jgi:hypothetical protein
MYMCIIVDMEKNIDMDMDDIFLIKIVDTGYRIALILG